ncbi:hypothetical protein KY285_035787 [Solanum tuberosum]|nr:hypothetical protein KY285_035787 [Solanum tuberosum]
MSNSGGDEERARLEAEIKGRNDFTLQAMHQQFERWTLQFQEMRDMIIEQNDTITAIRRENNVVPPNNVRPQVRRHVPHIPFVNPKYDNDDFDVEFNLERRDRKGQRGRVEDDNINSIKMKMPSFKGTRDPDLYLDWERRVEAIFDCHNYSEDKKVKLAVVEFSDYAASWWKNLARDRLQEELPPIATWAEMKRVMRKRFIPSYFQRDLQSRLQHLKQSSMSVDEYFKSMDMAMIQANCMEEEEATIARFLNVEKQIEKRQQNNSWRSRPNTISKKPWSTQEGKAPSKPQDDRGKGKVEEGGKTFNPKSSKPSSSIQCHKCHGRGHMMHECPSRRNILLRENGDYENEKSEGEEEEGEGVSEEDDLELPNDGIIGVVRRIMTINLGSVDEGQRENLFHTRCGIKGKTYSMIIDGGSCANVVSSYLVDKLGIACMKRSTPYRLQWLNDCGEVKFQSKHVMLYLADLGSMIGILLIMGERIGIVFCIMNFEDVFPDDTPKGLPPLRGIEHQIDFVPGSQLPNRPAYRSNPEETKELQRQVEELLEKGFVREKYSYNRTFHSSTGKTPFEIVYGFNPLIPLDLLPLPTNDFANRDGKKKADMMKKIHEQTRLAIEKKNKEVALRRNKGRKYVVFKTGDLVRVHMRKERFPSKRKTKLDPRGSGPYKVLERIGDNAYKLDLPGEFQVSATVNVSDLSHFDADLNSRTNSLQEEGNDSIQGSSTPLKDKDEALETPRRSITRSQTKEFNDKLNGLQSLIQRCLIGEEELKPKGEELSKCYNYLVAQIQAQDEEF